ncbi:MAG: CDP-alcohol phosphatidyltransferase family protein [Pseudomonadales bacterium]
MSLAYLPNLITVARIFLVLPTAWLLWDSRYVEALVLMSIAGASDALDGWLARRLGALSQLGAALDPVADKLLVAAMIVIFTIQGHLPLWLTLIVVGRDATILAGAGVYRLLFDEIELAPTFISKTNTAVQIATLLIMLLSLCGFGALSTVATALIDPYCFYLLALLGIASGVDYVVTWSVRALRRHREHRESP